MWRFLLKLYLAIDPSNLASENDVIELSELQMPWASARGVGRGHGSPWIFTHYLLNLPNFKNPSIFGS